MQEDHFFPYSWHVDKEEKEVTSIRIYGLGHKNNENICVCVDDFTPYIYLELPTHINWDSNKAQLVGNKLNDLLKDQKPLLKILFFKKKLYGAFVDINGKHKLFPYLFCSFSSRRDIKTLGYKIRTPLYIISLGGTIKLKLHESDADEIMQLTCLRQIPTAGWVKFYGKLKNPSNMVTSCDKEYQVKWKNLHPLESDKVPRPKIMGYDIEVNSTIPSAMPKSSRYGDKIFQISCVLCRYGDPPDKYEKYLLTLGQPDQDEVGQDVLINMYNTEFQLLEGFTDFIREKNPNLLAGYNILGFDIPYMIDRAKLHMCMDRFDQQGFHKWAHARETTIKWSSSAYKNQEFQFLDAEGRVYIDLLPLVRRDYKFANYKLATIADHFIGESKDPLGPKGIFKCYRIGTKTNKNGEYSSRAQKAMGIVGKYCIQDSNLVVLLMDKIHTWVGLTEMAKTCNVPIFTLYTQGQQIKVYAQLYKFCMYENIVVEKDVYKVSESERYLGAHVFPPVPGRYNNIVPFDFASLYPTIIIAYNIDYHTWVPDDSDIPNSKCHIMEWEDHIGCLHDPKMKKIVELTTYITKENNKIKKLREKRDKIRDKYYKDDIVKEIKSRIEELKPYVKQRSELNKTKPKQPMCEKRYYRFLKKPRGILPTIIQNLLDARKHTRKVDIVNCKEKIKILEQDGDNKEKIEELKRMISVLDKRQLAYKISANSVGSTTPIPCNLNGSFMYRTIEEISKGDWKSINDEQEISTPVNGLRVWSDLGWTHPKYVMRHPQQATLKRIVTHTGLVDCTDDHSLLSPDGTEVKPVDLKEGDELMHYPCPLPTDTPIKPLYRTLSRDIIRDHTLFNFEEEMAFVHGLFFAEGTAGTWGTIQKGRKSSWIIYNQDEELLSRAENILNQYAPTNREFKISRFYDSGRVYHLTARGNIKSLCDEYRTIFYDCRKHKIIPDYVLTAPLATRQAFLLGYYAGDGAHNLACGIVISNKEMRGTAALLYLARSLGYKVSISNGKNNLIFRLQCCTYFREKKETTIKSIRLAPETDCIENTTAPEIRNKEKISFYESHCSYRNISITSERFPRQMLFDSLDDAIQCAEMRNAYIIEYTTFKKSVTYKKYCCGKTYKISLACLKKRLPECGTCLCEQTNSINCLYNETMKYTPPHDVEYVYDIETENHHFAAGIGNLIVHNSMYGIMGTRKGYIPFMPGAMCVTYKGRVNIKLVADRIINKYQGELVAGDTDSTYIYFPHMKNESTHDLWEYAEHVAEEVTKLFPPPVKLEFEESIYAFFFILTKKRYMYRAINSKEGVVEKEIGKKGVLLARRDNSKFVRDIYEGVITRISNDVCRNDILYWILGEINTMFTRGKPYSDFVITKSIGNSGELQAEEFINDKGVTKAKVGDYIVPILSDDKDEREKQLIKKKATNPEDFNLLCLPAQVQLAERMKRRGQRVDVGSRIEYVVTDPDNHTAKQGEKIESADYFMKHGWILKMDYFYYLKALATPLDQVLNVAYGKDMDWKEDFVLNHYKFLLKNKYKLTQELNNMVKPNLVFIE